MITDSNYFCICICYLDIVIMNDRGETNISKIFLDLVQTVHEDFYKQILF